MNDEYDVYEFVVSVWEDDGEWLYSVVQEFDDDDAEFLVRGSADTALEALEAVSDFIPTIDFH